MKRTVDFWHDRVNRGARVDVNVRRLLYEMGLDLSPFLLLSMEAADEALVSIESAIVAREGEWLVPLIDGGRKLPATEEGLAIVRATLESFIQTCIARREAPFDALVGRR